MRIRKPGKIRDGLYFLGREESCVYLLEGEKLSMIMSGGMSYLVPDILDQLERFGIDETGIRKLLILHAHFDHVGIVPFFKRRHPDMEILGSARARELLGSPKVLSTINQFSREVAGLKNKKKEVYSKYDVDWRDDIRGTNVFEGQALDLGGMTVRIFETPGHSSCAITAYVPEIKALFPSDSGGIPYGNTLIASGNSDFTRYQRSLERLEAMDLEVEYVCADHYGYITGKEAGRYIRDSIVAAKEHRAFLEDVYTRTKDIDRATEIATRSFYDKASDYLVPPSIMEGVYRQMVRHIQEAVEGPQV